MRTLEFILERSEFLSGAQRKNHTEFFMGVTQLSKIFRFDSSRMFKDKIAELNF